MISLTADRTNLICFVSVAHYRPNVSYRSTGIERIETHGEMRVDLLRTRLVQANETLAEIVASVLEVRTALVIGEERRDGRSLQLFPELFCKADGQKRSVFEAENVPNRSC